ncbi:21652_t:CDS:2 [Cetraspora pellucida]|uniref:21652_t:CDS:1 n=1 Tax=Cetraspora pellucida TaxID=1433469 RepID=A0A9N9F0A3_9GLOM|nr:21652_t:CDS:2 [Cetraspora pellucida]
MISSILEDKNNMISSLSVIVEIDETKMDKSKRKYHQDYWVDRTTNTLLEVIFQHVLEGSIMYTNVARI